MIYKISCSHNPVPDLQIYYNNQNAILSIDAWSYMGVCTIINYEDDHPILEIGKFCSIAMDCTFLFVRNHPYDFISTYPFYENIIQNTQIARIVNQQSKKYQTLDQLNINIGNDVWIGRGVTLMPGVKISDGCVIGANSVVATDLPPYAIAYGNPCKIKKFRFTSQQIIELCEIRWWDWDLKKINDNLELIQSVNVDEFIRCFR